MTNNLAFKSSVNSFPAVPVREEEALKVCMLLPAPPTRPDDPFCDRTWLSWAISPLEFSVSADSIFRNVSSAVDEYHKGILDR